LKNYRVSLLFTLVIFLFVGCANNPTVNTEKISSTGLLWKIAKPGTTPSYIFGTMHSEDKRVLEVSEAVNDAFVAANTFVMEMVLDDSNTKKIMQGMYFDDGRTLRSVTNDKIYRQSVEALAQKGMPEKIVRIMKPWAVFTVLSMPEQKTGLFLDAMLYEAALKQGKDVVGLETTQEQLDVFDEMNMKTQVSLLETTLDSADELNKILEETTDIYLSHDLLKIHDLNARYMALLDDDVAEEFNQRLLLDRNINMATRMMPSLEKGNAFIAIGALHLPGRTGVLSIVKNAGYAVTPVD